MLHRLRLALMIEVRLDAADGQLVLLGQELLDAFDVDGRLAVVAGQVQLDAVAGAENHGLAGVAAVQFLQGGRQHRAGETKPFADFDGCGLEAGPRHQQIHGWSPSLGMKECSGERPGPGPR